MKTAPIGIFDSGYGGLTILKEIRTLLPDYDFVYLGDNARTPYGNRSFETVYEYTLQCVQWLFSQNCPLVVLACNTASAKALRTIQQTYLPAAAPQKRVLGVIRPTAEIVGDLSASKKIGILGTKGTVKSESYVIEIEKFFPQAKVYQHACPMWVPIVENNEYDSDGADFFIEKDLRALLACDPGIDTVLLACTHYPLLAKKILKHLPNGIKMISQGSIVAESLKNYLRRHPKIDALCSKQTNMAFFTTDSPDDFDRHSQTFFGHRVHSVHVDL